MVSACENIPRLFYVCAKRAFLPLVSVAVAPYRTFLPLACQYSAPKNSFSLFLYYSFPLISPSLSLSRYFTSRRNSFPKNYLEIFLLLFFIPSISIVSSSFSLSLSLLACSSSLVCLCLFAVTRPIVPRGNAIPIETR